MGSAEACGPLKRSAPGATVATTTGTSNVEWVRDLGADIVIDYRTQDFETVVHDYDVVLDSQGGTRSRSRCGSSSQGASPSASPARRTRISPASSDDASRCCR